MDAGTYSEDRVGATDGQSDQAVRRMVCGRRTKAVVIGSCHPGKTSDKDIKQFCGRGLPWGSNLQKVGDQKGRRKAEDHAWEVGDFFTTTAATLTQMLKRKGKSIGLERENCEFLDYILEAEASMDSLAGAMAKAAAPRPKKQGKTKERGAPKRRSRRVLMILKRERLKTSVWCPG